MWWDNVELEGNKASTNIPGVQRFKLAESVVINVGKFTTNEISNISGQQVNISARHVRETVILGDHINHA